MASIVQSEAMTPKEFAPAWKCRHCKHRWLIVNEGRPPKRCPNRKCRAADWNRPKIKPGRPKIKPQQSRKRRR